MDEQGCPRCKTTKYRNPSLKLLVNTCGHTLCENCVDMLFVRGSGSCPECGTGLRRANFRMQMFEDAYIEKEVDIRKRILKDFNKKEEDFSTLREYNDYLEYVETIVFNLCNGNEVEETKRKIDQYKKENKEFIAKNKSKLSKDDEYLELLIEQEKQGVEKRKLHLEETNINKNQKKKNKEALIDELMFSTRSAQEIMSQHQENLKMQEKEQTIEAIQAATRFSSGIKVGHQDMFLPVPKAESGELYIHEPVVLEQCGIEVPSLDNMRSHGYISHIRGESDAEKGGGFQSIFACHRAMQEAFNGLYFRSEGSASQTEPSTS